MRADERPAYQRDPYRRSLETEVLELEEDGRGPWAVLADTLLYPGGGGQPSDRGSLSGVPVLDVERRDGRIRHRLERPVALGGAVLELDWSRRFDHMQQHTAQHLLSAIAQDRHGWATTSFHLGDEACDVELDVAGLDEGRRLLLEEELAAEIRAARRVTTRWVSLDQLEALGDGVRTRGLPAGFEGDVRLVEIEGVDLNACGGTHLRSTAEIESIKLLGTERMRGGTRLHWVAGGRVRARLAGDEQRLSELRGLLECADEELLELLEKKLGRLDVAERRVRDLQKTLAEQVASSLAASPEEALEAHFEDEDAGFLREVSRVYTASDHPGMALLTAAGDGAASFLVAAGGGSNREASEIGSIVAEVLGGRGGGRGAVFQGRAGSFERRGDAVERIASWLRADEAEAGD